MSLLTKAVINEIKHLERMIPRYKIHSVRARNSKAALKQLRGVINNERD